ncbi:MAG: hypothetical protein ACRYG8_30215 [Janthinobacterium lividum]
MTIPVSGGTGMVGSRLPDQLALQGDRRRQRADLVRPARQAGTLQRRRYGAVRAEDARLRPEFGGNGHALQARSVVADGMLANGKTVEEMTDLLGWPLRSCEDVARETLAD